MTLDLGGHRAGHRQSPLPQLRQQVPFPPGAGAVQAGPHVTIRGQAGNQAATAIVAQDIIAAFVLDEERRPPPLGKADDGALFRPVVGVKAEPLGIFNQLGII